MRALHLISAFFPGARGAAYAALRLARQLRVLGVGLEFVCDESSSGRRGVWEHEGFTVRAFPLCRPGKRHKLRGFAAISGHALRVRGNVEVLHVHGGGHVNITLAWWLRRLTGWRVVFKTTLDGWDTPDGIVRDRYGRWLLRCYRTFDHVIAMTSGQADKIRALSPRTAVSVIPNGVDCGRYRPVAPERRAMLRADLGLPPTAPVLLYAGYLGYRKGTDVLFRVWRQVRARRPDTFLLCVGDYLGVDGEGDRQTLFRELGLAGQSEGDGWRVHGRVEDLERYLQAADLFVFPSRQEGFGTVQIEAMACGLPCVVNELPGISIDLFPDTSCGFRIPDNREEEYVRRIEDLLADPARREAMGRAARQRAVEAFSIETVASRYLAVYKAVV